MRSIVKKMLHSFVALTLTMQLLTGMLVAMPTTVRAASVCTNDAQGANDEPGQKDLTQMCSDGASLPTSIAVTWNWDEIAWSGNNTGDACALFDSNNDGDADYAFCVIIGGSPAQQLSGSPKVYKCNDTREDRCAGKQLVSKTYLSTCAVSTGTDPFPAGTSAPSDTKASCTIYLSDFSTSSAPSTAKLIDVCSYPSQEPNSDPSDCIIASTGKTTTVEVVKDVAPNSDNGTFDLFVNTTKHVDDGPDGSTTGAILISDTSDLIVKESAGNGTSLTDYTTTVSCVNQNGSSVQLESTSLTGSDYRTASIDSKKINEGDNLKCTFVNTRKSGSIVLIKNVINDNGGTLGSNDFGLTIGGQAVTSGQSVALTSGTPVVINEVGAAGYEFVEITGGGCPTVLGGTVTPVSGQTITCTITNNDIAPKLTVIKNVVNTNGANDVASDFTMQVFGTDVSTWEFPGSETGTTVTLDAGSYYVAETFEGNGYASSLSPDCAGSIALGETKTCTITNTSVTPQITIKKHVVNDNGGTLGANSFGIKIGNSSVAFGAGTETATNTLTYVSTSEANANTDITISEQDVNGYAEGLWVCSDGSQGSGRSVTVNLIEGEKVTCEVTNNDVAPTLTLYKEFINQWGTTGNSSNFTFYIGANQVSLGDATSVMPGLVEFSESFASGWELDSVVGEGCEIFGDLSGTISVELGGTYTCTLVNKDQPATITISKFVYNNNSGGLEAADFKELIQLDGYDGEWELDTPFSIRTDVEYTVTENDPYELGYTFDGVNCFDTSNQKQVVMDSAFTATPGQQISCTVFNDDIAHPEISVEKYGPDSAQEGEEVYYYFAVSNTGDVNLSGVSIMDDIAGEPTRYYGDDGDDILEVGETWWYQVSYTVPSDTTENIVNTVNVCAYQYGYSGEPINDEGPIKFIYCDVDECSDDYEWDARVLDESYRPTVVCDEDDHEMDVIHPEIKVVKSGPASAPAGSNVAYTFTVTNPGDVEIEVTSVEDDIAGSGTYVSGDIDLDMLLDVDETWIYQAIYTIPANQTADVVNTVVVCGQLPRNEEVEASRLLPMVLESEEGCGECDPENTRVVCDTDTHTLTIPVTIVQGTKTLSNTGVGSTVALYLAGAILVIVGGLELARRKN